MYWRGIILRITEQKASLPFPHLELRNRSSVTDIVAALRNFADYVTRCVSVSP